MTGFIETVTSGALRQAGYEAWWPSLAAWTPSHASSVRGGSPSR
jgi:hypothetical protein